MRSLHALMGLLPTKDSLYGVDDFAIKRFKG